MKKTIFFLSFAAVVLLVLRYALSIENSDGYGGIRKSYYLGRGCLALDIISVGDDTSYFTGIGRYRPWGTHKLFVPEILVDSLKYRVDSVSEESGRFLMKSRNDSSRQDNVCVEFFGNGLVRADCSKRQFVGLNSRIKFGWINNYRHLFCR